MAMKNKRLVLTPPDKGSFPLDHENICREPLIKYLGCLIKNDQKITPCRPEIKAYLDCRMNNDLMKREPWSKLGFHDSDEQK